MEYLRAGPRPAEWCSVKPLYSTSRRGFPAPSLHFVEMEAAVEYLRAGPRPAEWCSAALSLLSFSLCSETPAPRTQMEPMCRVGAHAMQAMQALRPLSRRSLLQQLMLRDACPACSIRGRVPSGCLWKAGYAGTAQVGTTSSLQRLNLRDACPVNSNGDHLLSRCSGDAGYAVTTRCSCNAGFEALRQLSLISRAQMEIMY